MATNRVGRTPSVEEALQRLSGVEIDASPVDQGFDEVAKQLYAVAPPLPNESEPASFTDAPTTVDAVATQPQTEPTAVGSSALLEGAQDGVDVITTDQLLDTIRASSQNAVRRLASVTGQAATARALLPVESTNPLPGISELSREVERAVSSAVAAASYHQDVEQRATAMASRIVADAAAEAERKVERAAGERESMLAGARSEVKELISDGKAQRDAIIARAEAKAEGIVEQAQVERTRRVRHIADTTGAIADIADAALGRLAAGSLTGEQLAQFVTELGAAAERIIAASDTKDQ